ncbi:unnamed protein product [Cladocopium goreaui]|uniref:Uncharacterized protein n=1 Tax=Cladocopium goreaui TaxID=2562237 RepID=A0A9P1DUM2_9DINO|nr:unnamed protein product [Cladocopium goreaui]
MAPCVAKAPETAARILELLKGDGNPSTERSKETTLEYRGQWQPTPNGAQTGHGVVPQDWAIEVASENDRSLVSFGWAGGAQLCLSNAFGEANKLEAQAQDLIDHGCSKDDAAVQCIRAIATASEEREALMRRQWCDIDFQQGEEANQELLKHLERDFATQLVQTSRRLQKETSTWYYIKRWDPEPGHVYLSAALGGDGLALSGHDDESGRHRWQLLPEGREDATEECHRNASWHLVRLLGGTPQGRRLLSRNLGGLELFEFDDGTGRQRWQVEGGPRGHRLRAARGDPGLGAAKEVEATFSGRFVGASEGHVTLKEDEECWDITGPTGSFCANFQVGGSQASKISLISKAPGRDVLSYLEPSMMAWKELKEEQVTQVLGQNRNLGTAIDLIGVYLKNYEIDKADRLCAQIAPLCLERGGVWYFKLLNFYTTVRMKQSRYQEALEMYKEYETLINFSPEEAWELYDTVYRNFGWIYTSLRDFPKALEYFEKCVSVKRAHGVPAHWFDQWDLGKTHARLSLQLGRFEDLALAAQLIGEALEMHRTAEPTDTIMRCKMLNSAGECYMVRGDFCQDAQARNHCYDKAIKLQEESYQLYMQVLGPKKPLTGWAMEDLAGAYQRRGRLEDAKPLLLQALRVECSKDIIKLASMARLLDSVLELHEATSDNAGLAACQDAINEGLENLQKRGIHTSEAVSYAALLQKIAKILLAHDELNRDGAVDLLEEGLRYLSGSAERSRSGQPDTAADDEEERHFYIPKAGQQELDVDAAALHRDIEVQLEQLRHSAAAEASRMIFEVVDDEVTESCASPQNFTSVD